MSRRNTGVENDQTPSPSENTVEITDANGPPTLCIHPRSPGYFSRDENRCQPCRDQSQRFFVKAVEKKRKRGEGAKGQGGIWCW